MAGEKKVIATYGKGWKDDDLLNEDMRIDGALPAEWGRVMDYDDIDDLVRMVKFELDIDPDHPSLKLLEIVAHGNPAICNDIHSPTIAAAASKLMTLKWSDNADIYLCACNTANGDPNDPEPRPIAELLAKAMAFDLSTFPHRITVYGSVGYLSGTHMAGNEKTSATYSDGHTDYSRPGAKKESGNNCWHAYHNW